MLLWMHSAITCDEGLGVVRSPLEFGQGCIIHLFAPPTGEMPTAAGPSQALPSNMVMM